MFLTPEQLKQLTGRRRKKLQVEWLRSRGFKFEIRCDGQPVVLESAVAERLGGVRKVAEPNWGGLDS